MRRLKDIEDSADAGEGSSLSLSNGSSASQHSVSEVLARSIPAASLRPHQRSQTQNSHVSQASQHSKKSQ